MPSLKVEQQAAAPSVFCAGALEICRRGASILGDPRVEISKIRLGRLVGMLPEVAAAPVDQRHGHRGRRSSGVRRRSRPRRQTAVSPTPAPACP